jgi:hypothetical protein
LDELFVDISCLFFSSLSCMLDTFTFEISTHVGQFLPYFYLRLVVHYKWAQCRTVETYVQCQWHQYLHIYSNNAMLMFTSRSCNQGYQRWQPWKSKMCLIVTKIALPWF